VSIFLGAQSAHKYTELLFYHICESRDVPKTVDTSRAFLNANVP